AKRQVLVAGLANSDIAAANNVRELVTRTLEQLENQLLLLGRQTSLERVAAFLLEMDRRLDKRTQMSLPMSRRDIADYLGLRLETVSRCLSVLRRDGILSFIGQTQREIELHDRSRLVEWATASLPHQWHPKAKQDERTMSCNET